VGPNGATHRQREHQPQRRRLEQLALVNTCAAHKFGYLTDIRTGRVPIVRLRPMTPIPFLQCAKKLSIREE